MKCATIKRRIPLYVGRDLRPQEADQVTTHLSDCPACRQLTNEFEESRRWSQTLTPPAFDDALLRSMRQGIRQAISETNRSTNAPPKMPSTRWLAAVAALLLLATGATIALRTLREMGLTAPVSNVGHPIEVGDSAPLPETVSVVKGSPGREDKPSPDVAKTRIGRSQKVSSSPVTDTAMKSDAVAEGSPKGPLSNPRSTEETMLRIEFQTEDPNIRIIWFAPPGTGEAMGNGPATR